MLTNLASKTLASLVVATLVITCCSSTLYGQKVPDLLKARPNDKPKSTEPSQIAADNILALDVAMMGIYKGALTQFQQEILSETPIILAMFTSDGGQMVLYRPAHDPITAPSVPIAYQFAKSCGHSAMAVYQLTAPYLNRPTDKSWRSPMMALRAQVQAALDTLPALKIDDKNRKTLQLILEHNLTFMDNCLKKNIFTIEELESFAKQFKPLAEKAIAIAAGAQVSHWMSVLDEWKKDLGDDWGKTYAATNTMYVTRQNNILYSILAQYMGKDAIHRRLLLFETTDFFTTKEQMLSLLTRIMADRALGEVFFGNKYLMDYELLGSQARRDIVSESERRGLPVILPTMSPFNSTEWPWRTDPNSGSGPSTIEETD
ncbi:hypothetical protein Mal52_30540 [Symmachiella dynata]|uniref:Uncharacterized protein n=1 Tax=Symmachiella dynata TaxID=2527995 RepID=A0A517ZQ45_9PLAN|nr:hypothetical protein [Symmachiella dynata]QDU44570.1 hypothetical protein Mal52_30540 [Symmachiella dynata]